MQLDSITVTEKECRRCSTVKTASDFPFTYGKLSGRVCKSCRVEYYREKRRADPEYKKRWYASAKAWSDRNPERVVKALSARNKRKLATSPAFCLAKRVRHRLYMAMRRNAKSSATFDQLPYTISELRVHLESQFLPGMSWENMGKWHIDHITLLSHFGALDAGTPEFERAWGLPNLRPLWAADNLRKHKKVEFLL